MKEQLQTSYSFPSDILAIDVGSGTQDILIWRNGIPVENCPKLVLPSWTSILAALILQCTENKEHIFLTGKTMGGGPCSSAIRKHLKKGLKVFALEQPALTFNDNLDKVKNMGIEIVDSRPNISPLRELAMCDVNMGHLRQVLALFHIPFPEIIAISVQDHGFSPTQSNRAFRFKLWAEMLDNEKPLENMLYQEPPRFLTRMRAVYESVPGAWLMDTGASAILGALLDPWIMARKQEGVLILNIGNEHTLAALVKGEKVWGIYEHHTSLLTREKLKDHLTRFRQGQLTNEEIFDDMGHGCKIVPGASQASEFNYVGITGPNRNLFKALGGHMAAPFGDMMLTGCFGLVAAVKRRLGTRNG